MLSPGKRQQPADLNSEFRFIMQISSEHPVTITKRTPDKVKIIFFIEYLLILRRSGNSEIILFSAPFTIYTKTRERNNTKI